MKFSDITLGLLTATLLSTSALADPSATVVSQPAFLNGISGDGLTLVGADGGQQLAISGPGGYQALGNLDSVAFTATAVGYAASYDGSVIVGQGFDGSSYRAFRYQSGTFTELTDMGPNPMAVAVSDNGQDIAGYSVKVGDSTIHALAWLGGSTSLTDLGSLDGPSQAFGISDNGIIVGYQNNGAQNRATSWTFDGTVHATTLAMPPSTDESVANAISRDGSTIVGYVTTIATQSAVMWQGSTVTYLSANPGSVSSEQAFAVSQTGKIIVGASDGGAFRWTENTGMQNLGTLLSNAGVNMTGITLTSAGGISDDGTHIITTAIVDSSGENMLVVYDLDADIAGATTQADVQAATQQLADEQRNRLIQSGSTADILLGMLQAPSDGSNLYTGGMFGSGEGLFGGQFVRDNITLHGGIAYGYQDSGAVDQSSSVSVALAGRYTFQPVAPALRPYAEIGGWVTPNETLTLSRPYANGAGTAIGTGNSGAYDWAGYGQLGLLWQAQHDLQLSAFGELRQQALNYDGYSEALSSANPFPAKVQGGTLRYDVARLGGSVSRTIEGGMWPVTGTLSGALAHAFNMQSGLRVNVAGVGSTQGASTSASWGEYGAEVSVGLTKQLSANAGVIATSGNNGMGTQIHGLAGLSYRF
jgi:probable HAF family extracellular repeat protein